MVWIGLSCGNEGEDDGGGYLIIIGAFSNTRNPGNSETVTKILHATAGAGAVPPRRSTPPTF